MAIITKNGAKKEKKISVSNTWLIVEAVKTHQ